ncbi:fimbrial protein FaeF [Escherichia coli]|uniref:DUF5462 family protein n=1 Tax=Escherichia coli TaxID=562 RepID=UPI0010CB0151|nr:DUF5462 family protein [Escherichia coli]GCU67687.1 fimbrial protein FaeF [Escherichia coli]GCZ35219.1 fimbrial protein FaeF [Escherichia coli]
MKAKIIVAGLIFIALSQKSVQADEYSEKTQYMGVMNGQIVGNSVVKVTRMLTEPVLYRSANGTEPECLTIRNAEVRPAPGGMVYISVKQVLSDNREARITLKTGMFIGGKKIAFSTRQQGEDAVIIVPAPSGQVVLRTDEPAEFEIPANYRGKLQIPFQVED